MECCETKTSKKSGHVQVPFRTLSGIQVEVDEGMLEILTLLRELGVETLYSCEGVLGESEKWFKHDAYILCNGRQLTVLLAKIFWLHKRGRYSNRISWLAHRFANGTKDFEYGKFKVWEQKSTGKKVHETKSKKQFVAEGKFARGYVIEELYSKHYGWRATIRWWKLEDGAHVKELLRETKELLGR